MRKEYRKAVAQLFSAAVAEAAPAFEPVKVKSMVLWGGESVFRWVACEGLHVYLILVPSPTGHQSFTLEVGWSTASRFPEVTARPSVMLGPDDPDPVDMPEGIVRLGALRSRVDTWWRLPDPAVEQLGSIAALQKSLEPLSREDARRDASPPVAAAMEALMAAGVPFAERLVDRHCGRPGTPRSAS